MITFLKFLENKEETAPEPWKFTKEQFVKHVMPFKTSQGSVYGHMVPYGSGFGKTVRIKSLHAQHDPNDKGLKKGSHKTVYVKPKDAQTIGLWNS
jgi:hypothetical protein